MFFQHVQNGSLVLVAETLQVITGRPAAEVCSRQFVKRVVGKVGSALLGEATSNPTGFLFVFQIVACTWDCLLGRCWPERWKAATFDVNKRERS